MFGFSFPRKILLMSKGLVANLWYHYDSNSGFISAIAGRGYILDGSDDEKVQILQKLAATDYLYAKWLPVPDRYVVHLHEPATGREKEVKGVVSVRELDVLGLSLFAEVLTQIESEVPKNEYRLVFEKQIWKVDEKPLYCMTGICEKEAGAE